MAIWKMRGHIFVDTTALYMLVDLRSSEHKQVRDFIEGFNGNFVITNYIFSEIVTLVRRRAGHEKAVVIGETILKSSQIERIWITPSDEKEAWNLFVSRRDKSYSFTDCTSFVVMRRMKIKRYLAFDEHFKQEGFEGVL